jgi:molecular chaperone DnaK (HSP70)
LNNLKIINSPNCSILCFQNNIIDNDNSNDESISSSFSFQSCSKENNILLLYISNDYISISINSINNQRVENNYKDKSKYHYIKKYQVKNNIDFNLKEKEINKNNILFDKIMLEIRNILIKSKISEISIDDIILIGDMSKSNYIKKKLSELFINNKIIYDKLNEYNFENDDYYLVSGAALESTSNTNKINNYIFNDICPISFGIENFNSKVDLLIKKGEKLPCSRRNFVKLYKGKNCDFVEVNIYEINGEKSQMMLSSSQLNCQKMKLFNDGYNKVGNNYVELLFEFDVDENSNLSVFILDIKSFKKKFEFAINIDVIKE